MKLSWHKTNRIVSYLLIYYRDSVTQVPYYKDN